MVCPVCWGPCHEHLSTVDHGGTVKKDEGGLDEKAALANKFIGNMLNAHWLQCPCCNYDPKKRGEKFNAKQVWQCNSILDDKPGRLYCSRLCGDASIQIECDHNCDDHGCAACFKDGNVTKVEPGTEVEAFGRGWICKEGEDDDLNDLGEDEEDLLGFDGLPVGENWWEREAKRCRETGRLFGECICGECVFYEGEEVAVDGGNGTRSDGTPPKRGDNGNGSGSGESPLESLMNGNGSRILGNPGFGMGVAMGRGFGLRFEDVAGLAGVENGGDDDDDLYEDDVSVSDEEDEGAKSDEKGDEDDE
ncbi:hypothetical protein HDU76_005220 [Blyttiomyces sp. JEL0837]|nr:hypothetical protein HDU76_005220 [Blyttiomyces sp. JEL0837]